MTEPVALVHNKVRLALHPLRGARDGSGPGSPTRPLLCLHGLGELTSPEPPAAADAWPGPVWGLDLTGHGASTRPSGGGYTAELLMADVDAALAHLGPCTLLGRGLGAYVALLSAGARAELVRGAVLADGPGLAGGGATPASPALAPHLPPGARGDDTAPDPFALLELARDVRPPDYAVTFVRLAVMLSGLDAPIAVAAVVRPPWLAAVADEPGVLVRPAAEALARYAREAGPPASSSMASASASGRPSRNP
ncbi:MAG: alpha/beta hydrolase [Actinobacteria bacterium]|nr:alpha/beta hydrolase [Actinomycetota bacterium]